MERNTPVAPLPNVGEGGPVNSGTGGGSNTPTIPLPNPGEGGPVGGGGSDTPTIPLPNPGEGGPVGGDGSNIPTIPLPNPGEGGPVADGPVAVFPVIPLPNPGEGGMVSPIWLRFARVRFLNAAFGYRPFRIFINNLRVINFLSFASATSYGRVLAGYQTVTVAGTDGYIYIQKSMPFRANTTSTFAIINTASGLDLMEITDSCCTPTGNYSNFRVSNLAYNSGPLDVLLGDGRVVYADVRFKETTAFKRIAPGAYQFNFAETNLTPMPSYLDIETLDAAFLGTYPTAGTVASAYVNVRARANYTVFVLSSGSAANQLQTMVLEDR